MYNQVGGYGDVTRCPALGDLVPMRIVQLYVVEQAGRRLGLIRKIVHVNLALGMITMIVAATGPYWP